MKRSLNRKRRRRGFTLMEMLIVLGILVVVFALAAPRFFGAREKADKNATRIQIEAFRGALDKYKFDTRNYPTTEQGLQALFQPPADSEDSSVNSWEGPYMNKPSLPKDPWGNDYQYAYPAERGSGDFPDIWSFGPDGEDNTEDDICSWTAGREGEAGGGEADFGGEMSPARNVDVGDVRVGGPGRDDF